MLQDVLFDRDSYKLESKHSNLVALSVDVGLLLRVLRGAAANDADALDVKLTEKAVAVAGSEEPQLKPFLTFNARVRRQLVVDGVGGARAR